MCLVAVPHDSPQSAGIDRVLELPEGITGQIVADKKLLSPW